MCLGISPRLERGRNECACRWLQGWRQTSLDLPAAQEELIKKIDALGKPIILVLVNGSPLSINWEKEKIPAIVESWYGGQAAGTALANVTIWGL